MKNQLPNLITLLNLICGCIAITQIAEGNLVNASILVLLGALFDFFDGFVARILKVDSAIGAELDSLADVVTFGLVPAYLAFTILKGSELPEILAYLAFLIAAFSAVRLAKFNVDEKQSHSFIGLPTPANALFWISLPLIQWQIENKFGFFDVSLLSDVIYNHIFILLGIILLSYLLIAPISLLSLKFKSLNWKTNKTRFLLLIFSVALFSILLFAAIPFILLLYFIFSIIEPKLS